MGKVAVNLNALGVVQDTMHVWRTQNFGSNIPPYQQLLGVIEEVGELAHAQLKYEQGIRGMDKEKYEREAKDAVGDLMIFLMGFCSIMGWDIGEILEDTVSEVLDRDWVTDPEKGGQDG